MTFTSSAQPRLFLVLSKYFNILSFALNSVDLLVHVLICTQITEMEKWHSSGIGDRSDRGDSNTRGKINNSLIGIIFIKY